MEGKTYTSAELQVVLEEHRKWLRNEGGSQANLNHANLNHANLDGANLDGANLDGANLVGASLVGASLVGASLTNAVLTNVKGLTAPVVPHIDASILNAIQNGGSLRMGEWHTCETTHCRAGWAIHLSGLPGKMLEDRIGPGPAGSLIYAASRPNKPIPDFFCDNADAMEDMQAAALEDPLPVEVMP